MAAIDSTAPEDAAAELASLRARVASLEAEAQRLRASVRVANAVIEETPLVIYAKGADQRFLLSNRRHASLIGLPPASILGHTDRELFGADADSIDAASARVLASGASSSSEFPLPIDGRERFFHETIFRLHDEGGAPLGLGGIAIDITARRLAEDENRMLSLAVEQSHEAIVVTDLAGNIEYVNEAFVQRTGYTREELIGQNPRMFQSGKTPRETYTALWDSLTRGETWKGEFVNRRKDGQEFIELDTISPVRQADGRVTHYLAIKQDVTALKRMSAELERHRMHLEELVRQRTDEMKAVFRALPDLYFRVDREGIVLDFISGNEGDLLVPPEEFLRRPLQNALPPELRARFTGALSEVARGAPLVVLEYDLPMPDGERSYEARVLPLGADQAVVVVRDIRERRRAEAALAAARDAAESASRLKSDFLARMSHEIRTPMASVVGYADLLLNAEYSPDEARHHARRIRHNADHLLGLLDDILDLSRIEADKLVFASEPVDPAKIIAAVDSLLRPIAVERGLALLIALDAPLPRRITTDPLRLQQVLVNLVSNALKFTDRGSVTVRASIEPARDLDGPWLRVDVVDTGIGIARDLLPRLFTAFTQVHSRDVARGRGTGLGLAISARLASGLHGRLDVASEVGSGSTFTLRVPVTAAETVALVTSSPGATPLASAAPPALAAPLRVLVVDDNPDLQVLLERMLARLGVKAQVVGNGQEALDSVAAADAAGRPFDVVLMDMQMPVLDGYDAVRALRERGSRVTVVALTAFAMAGDAERCLAAGCDAHLAKPVDIARLREMLGDLPRRGA